MNLQDMFDRSARSLDIAGNRSILHALWDTSTNHYSGIGTCPTPSILHCAGTPCCLGIDSRPLRTHGIGPYMSTFPPLEDTTKSHYRDTGRDRMLCSLWCGQTQYCPGISFHRHYTRDIYCHMPICSCCRNRRRHLHTSSDSLSTRGNRFYAQSLCFLTGSFQKHHKACTTPRSDQYLRPRLVHTLFCTCWRHSSSNPHNYRNNCPIQHTHFDI